MQYAVKNMPELRNGNIEITPMLDKPAGILNEILKCDFLVAMLYLAKHECKGRAYHYGYAQYSYQVIYC